MKNEINKTDADYIILYGKARRQIKMLEDQLERVIEKHSTEIQLLKNELNNPRIKAIEPHQSTMHKLLLTVCHVTNTTAGQLMSSGRERQIVTARHLFFYICRHEFNISWAKMTRLLDRHHTSAMHGAQQYANYLNLNYHLETKLHKTVMDTLNADENEPANN